MTLKTLQKILYGLLALFVIMIFVGYKTKFSWCGYVAIAALLMYGYIASRFFRCPNCGRGLRASAGHGDFKKCPSCGEEIDLNAKV